MDALTVAIDVFADDHVSDWQSEVVVLYVQLKIGVTVPPTDAVRLDVNILMEVVNNDRV